MKNIYKLLILAIVASSTLFYSCETLELENLASPNALAPDQADPDLLFNNIQLAYRNAVVTFNFTGGDLSRTDYMFGRNYFSNYGPGQLNGPWNNLYSSIIPDIANIEALDSPDLDLSFQIGAAKTMQAHVMMLLVDYLGDIVFSEAFNPTDFPSPSVDDDAAVYTAALAILAEGKAKLNSAGGAGTALDLYYGGDISKWIKLNNTLKMRADLTTGNYSAVISASNVLSDVSDDFEFSYGTNQLSPDTRHPDYANDYTASGANIYFSHWLIDLMVGDFGDLSSDTDPRRRYYFYRQSWRTPGNYALFEDVNGLFGPPGTIYLSNGAPNGETLQCSLQTVPSHLEFTPDEAIWCSLQLGYWGRFHGNNEGTPPDNFTRTAAGVYPAGGSFDWRADAFPYVGDSPTATFGQQVGLGNGGGGAGIEPIMLSSWVDFMKAEANLALGNTGPAATFLESGMTKSISKVLAFGSLDASAPQDEVPSATTVTNFINAKVAEFNAAPTTSAVDGFGFPVDKAKMDILGEQYFVALYGGAADGFNFIRRTGFPRTLSRNIEGNPGTFPRTLLYPSNEAVANPNINQRNDNSTLVFWDNGVINPAN